MRKPKTRHLKVFEYNGFMYFVNFADNVYHIRELGDPEVATPGGRRYILALTVVGYGLDFHKMGYTTECMRYRLKHADKVYPQ